jgi:hypothetical protein
VERRNSVFQDRLVKEMRLRGIQGIGPANAYLENRSHVRKALRALSQAQVAGGTGMNADWVLVRALGARHGQVLHATTIRIANLRRNWHLRSCAFIPVPNQSSQSFLFKRSGTYVSVT